VREAPDWFDPGVPTTSDTAMEIATRMCWRWRSV